MSFQTFNCYNESADLALSFSEFEYNLSQIDLEKDDVGSLMSKSRRGKKQMDLMIEDLERQFRDMDIDSFD
jgi:hypothetical protein